MLAAIASGAANCADGAALLAEKRAEIRTQIKRLRKVDARLGEEQKKLETRANQHGVPSTGALAR